MLLRRNLTKKQLWYAVSKVQVNTQHPITLTIIQLLLLLLHSAGSVLLESSVRDLETSQGADTDVQDKEEEERGNEAHEDTWEEVSTHAKWKRKP